MLFKKGDIVELEYFWSVPLAARVDRLKGLVMKDANDKDTSYLMVLLSGFGIIETMHGNCTLVCRNEGLT